MSDVLGPIMHKGKSVGGVTIDVVDEAKAGDMRPITSNAVAEISNSNKYNTEEQVVGTWIDGRPIYRKVFIGTTPSSSTYNGSYYVCDVELASNIKNLINYSGNIAYGDTTNHNTFNLIAPNSDRTVNCGYFIYDSNEKARIRMYAMSESLVVNLGYSVVLEYTKTTDSATV